MSLEFLDEGWKDYIGTPPPPDLLCVFRQPTFFDGHVRHDVAHKWIGRPQELDPDMNVAYLKWKPTGIGLEGL